MDEMTARFAALYIGNERSHGRFVNGRSETVRQPASPEKYTAHLEGTVGLGMVPIMDEGFSCWFGAIDIDCHGEDEEPPDLHALARKIEEEKMPLVCCRSKSGGAHIYIFAKEPIRAIVIRHALTAFAAKLGYPRAEIFPKQHQLKSGHLGNWINLPYYDHHETKRYAVHEGRALNLSEFLDLAESRRVEEQDIAASIDVNLDGVPPCVEKMIQNGVDVGFRNEALYAITVFLRKSHPEWRKKALDLSQLIFARPLTQDEARRTIDSAGRRDYAYKCRQEPCISLCNADECVTRKYGVKSGVPTMPTRFERLIRYNTEPAVWELWVDGREIKFSKFADLLCYKRVKEEVGDRLKILLPPLKNEQWERLLDQLLSKAEDREAPNEASAHGILATRLAEFVRRSGALDRDGEDDCMSGCFSGGASLHNIDGTKVILFRLADFKDYLKKVRVDEVRGTDTWFVLRAIGVQTTTVRWQNQTAEMCYVPLTEDMELSFPKVLIRSEF